MGYPANYQTADIEKICDHVGPFIRARREELRLSLQEVADRIGASKAHIWELENGRAKNPTVRMILGLAVALECSVDTVLGIQTSKPVLSDQEMSLIAAHRRIFKV